MTNPSPDDGAPSAVAHPYGQPTYGQQAYGQAPAWAQPQHGQPPFGQPPFGQPQVFGQPTVRPSGATAVIASVLAFLGALHMFASGVLAVVVLQANSSHMESYLLVVGAQAVLSFVAMGLLVGGAIGVLRHSMSGRRILVIGAGLVLVIQLVAVIASFASDTFSESGAGLSSFPALTLVLLAFPIATGVLAMLPSTVAWIRAR